MKVRKAESEELRSLVELLDRQESVVRRAFTSFLRTVRADWMLKQLRQLIESGRVQAAIDLVNAQTVALGNVIPQVFTAAGLVAADQLAAQFESVGITATFDPRYARAVALMERNQLDLVERFNEQQTQTTRAALSRGLDEGWSPLRVAREIRDNIGLTPYQYQVVDNYRRALQAGSSDILDRALRDRRYDSAAQRAIDGDVLSDTQIDRMVDRYRANMFAMRAETIARTETQRVLNQARHEAVQQTLDRAGIDPSMVTRTWNATQDDRTRDTHAEMDGQQRGMDEPFDSPSGAQMMMPGDDSLGAPAEEVINCRCVVTIDIAPADDTEEDDND